MNILFSPRPIRWLLIIVLALGCLSLLAAPLLAADFAGTTHSTAAPFPLQANNFKDFVGNRSRMIQISLVFVVFGCSLLWWRR